MLRFSTAAVRALLVLNILATLVMLGLLAFTYVAEARVLAYIGDVFPGRPVDSVLGGLRLILLLTVPIAVAAHIIFTRLSAILRTVEGGDPFLASNGERLRTIGWALLAIQIADLLFGYVSAQVEIAMGQRHFGWSPGVTGWLAVLLVFVLARVFSEGARMRDDLELTV